MSDLITVLTWAYTQVGKSSLLGQAITSPCGRLPIDLDASKTAIASTVGPNAEALRTGRLVQPTSEQKVDLDLLLTDGTPLCLRDIKGDLTRQVAQPWVGTCLEQADAYLFLIEWKARDLPQQINSIVASRPYWGDKPRALVFTKCELHLEEGHPAWSRPPGWWRRQTWLAAHAELIESFGDAVWPSSAYGYEERFGQPAVALGEYGQLIPMDIKPRGVVEPLAWLLGALRARRRGAA